MYEPLESEHDSGKELNAQPDAVGQGDEWRGGGWQLRPLNE